MTVASSTSRSDYTGNGVTTAFTGSFRILDQTHITVYRTQISTGVITTLALTTDYTVSGVGGTSFTVTCLVAPTSDQRISILRNVPLTQASSYPTNDVFPSTTTETALDKLTMLVQQLSEAQGRALSLGPTTTGVSTDLPTPAANQLVGWDATGTALINYSGAGSTIISTAMTPVVQAASLAAGRAALGSTTVGDAVFVAASAAAARSAMSAAVSGANSDITSLSALASINGGQIAGFRNRIINGAMSIDQRNIGAAQTITAAAALAYTVDRWYAYCTGTNVTGQQVAGTSPNQYNYRFTGAASVTKIGFAQRIEAANCQDLAGTTATLSVDLANSLLTTVTWTAWYANTNDTFGTLASPTRTQIATGAFTVSSTLTRYNTQINIPAAATTGIEVEFSVGAQTSGTWTIGRVQLERGSVATPFEVRPIQIEWGLCYRYRYDLVRGNGSFFGPGYCFSSTVFCLDVALPVPMRASPSLDVNNSTGTYAMNASGANALTSWTLGVATARFVELNATVASGVAGFSAAAKTTNSAAYIGLDAEL